MPLWSAQVFSYIIAIGINYILLRTWAFAKSSANSQNNSTSFVKYILLILINLPLTTLLVIIFENLGIAPFIVKLLVVGLAASWNYIIYDKFIFRPITTNK